MKEVEIGIALFIALGFADRLRQISWWSVKPVFVALYLTHLVWALSLLYAAATGCFGAQEIAGTAAALVMLLVTRPNWAKGVPESFTNGNRHLRQPDL